MRFLTEQADKEILGFPVRIREKGNTIEYSWDDFEDALLKNEFYLFAGSFGDDNRGDWFTARDLANWVKEHKFQLQSELRGIDSILKGVK